MAKRKAGHGSLFYRKDKGLWVVQANGKTKYSKDEDKARAKLKELLQEADSNKPENITVATLLDRYIEFRAPILKAASRKRYREIIRIYLAPAFGHERVSSLTAFQVQSQYSKWLAKGISSNTVYQCHTVLSGAFKRASKWQLVPSSVLQDVDCPKVEKP